MGCKGGAVTTTLDYAKKEGFVDDDCLNYTADDTIPCPNMGQCSRYKITDYCVAGTVEGIKREIFKNGPVISLLPIYRDFLIYKEGIYEVNEYNFTQIHSFILLDFNR